MLARPSTPPVGLGGLNLHSFSLPGSGRQSQRGYGTIPTVSAADGMNSMGTALIHVGEARGRAGVAVDMKQSALD